MRWAGGVGGDGMGWGCRWVWGCGWGGGFDIRHTVRLDRARMK